MKKLIVFVFVVSSLACIQVIGQQDAMYTQYMFNMLSVNPAYAGTKDAINIIALTRNQWMGFVGAPKTNSFTLHSPIGKTNLGIGFSLVKDKIGPLDVTNAFLDLASEVKIHEGGYLSLGCKAGFDARKTNLSQLNPLDHTDPTYYTDLISNLNPNLGAGIYYYTDNYYVGLSTPKLAARKIENENFSDGISEKIERHYFLIGGYVFDANEDLKLKPSFLAKKVKAAPGSLDLTVSAMYQERIIGGITNRIRDSFGLMMQVRIIQQLWFGCAYDFTISGLSKYNSGTYEFMLYYDANLLKKGIIKSPRFF